MDGTDWVVIAGSGVAIAWLNWYFFAAGRGATRAATIGSGRAVVQEITIAVQGGYSPSTIRVAAGRPVRLVFDRQETSSCSEEIVFPDFNLRRFLPFNEKTVVEITPPAPGTYAFTCGMSMLHGRVIAE